MWVKNRNLAANKKFHNFDTNPAEILGSTKKTDIFTEFHEDFLLIDKF